MSVLVFKLGGSLLSLRDVATRLERAISLFPSAKPLIVVGGGPAADVVRAWDDIHQLGEETSHWLAFKSLTMTESLIEQLVPKACRVASKREAEQTWERSDWPIVSLYDFVVEHERLHGQSLAHCWDVTSDSLAAFVANEWPADGLVLLKSVELPAEISLLQAAEQGLVDRYFPKAVGNNLAVSWINLRSEKPTPVVRLKPNDELVTKQRERAAGER